METIKKGRRKFELEMLHSSYRKYLSPIFYSQYHITLPAIQKYAHGKLIDLGAGDMPYREEIQPFVTTYDSLDFTPRSTEITFAGNLQNMDFIPDQTYDCAICLEVLEHIPDPFRAAKEMWRILKVEGVLIVSVPHLSRLHEMPHDYYRYTAPGLEYILTQAGFQILNTTTRGGLLSFIGHQIAIATLSASWNVRILKHLAVFLIRWLNSLPAYYIDRIFKIDLYFPAGYTTIAIRPKTES
jgi:SAM-dependent methyltransferase